MDSFYFFFLTYNYFWNYEHTFLHDDNYFPKIIHGSEKYKNKLCTKFTTDFKNHPFFVYNLTKFKFKIINNMFTKITVT